MALNRAIPTQDSAHLTGLLAYPAAIQALRPTAARASVLHDRGLRFLVGRRRRDGDDTRGGPANREAVGVRPAEHRVHRQARGGQGDAAEPIPHTWRVSAHGSREIGALVVGRGVNYPRPLSQNSADAEHRTRPLDVWALPVRDAARHADFA